MMIPACCRLSLSKSSECRGKRMKVAVSILLAGVLIAGAIYAGLTDGRRTYMKGCTAMAMELRQSPEEAEINCAFQYKR